MAERSITLSLYKITKEDGDPILRELKAIMGPHSFTMDEFIKTYSSAHGESIQQSEDEFHYYLRMDLIYNTGREVAIYPKPKTRA